uniref:TMhelix containing protein n=1 Tax=Meloidogyne javanica TaxID=6303 RepID=A0A915M408_MELJA
MAKSNSYKIMFVMGILDITAIIGVGYLTGYLGYFGYVFCSSPKFIYFVGAFGTFCWAAESMMDGILALNRCVEMWASDLARKIFGGGEMIIT